MNTLHIAISCALLAIFAFGCNKTNEPPKPTMTTPSTTTTSTPSVALPQEAKPSSDAAMKPTAPDTARGTDTTNPSQANPKALDKEQESAAMPLPGQANPHSTPDSLDKEKPQK